ncbi:CoA-disulfide reductase [Erysipelothrix larvae]|uniref:CoA-disulfide reductase n=1 Tax=Erysipelothrix larvae TaxID=1514105 RepID=A0A0X8GYP1_9FIRM|nr:FAD-dependent oxidoreductase [Erysipelothrix larvae]AMC92842.1 CoA-disulfide reductase [Erysipelothrix larvae]
MNQKRVVVVGGSAGGMSFATRYRRLNQKDSIIILERGPYVSYANCGLPYYISQEIPSREDLFVVDQDVLINRFKLDLKTEHEVVSLDSKKKVIHCMHHGKPLDIPYDMCVLSPGAKPFDLKISGSETHPALFTLRNVEDVDRIVDSLQSNHLKHAVVMGAGFIGLEIVENLVRKGLTVSVVEKSSQVLPPLDVEMAQALHQTLIAQGVKVYINHSVVSMDASSCVLDDGTRLQADLVLSCVGVVPDTQFAKQSGIICGMREGIVVDHRYQTNLDSVYALGDACITQQFSSKKDALIPLASPANRQGRHLADILSGKSKERTLTLGTSILRLFNLSAASTGLNEKQLEGQAYEVFHLSANDHAGYFPGATPILLKVLFDPKTHLILGAQAIGEKGVDKRIDVIATAIKANMKVNELQDLELAYAPPFGSAKDIVNMAGYVAENILDKTTHRIHWNALETLQQEGAYLLDVRNDEERAELGYIIGSHHCPLDALRTHLHTFPKDQCIIVYCQSSARSYNAECILRDAGFNVMNMDGSFGLYRLIRPDRIVMDGSL